MTRVDYTCFPEQAQNCYTTSRVSVKGWAHNGSTKPSQDVYITASGTFSYAYGDWKWARSFHSGVHPAHYSDVTDQRKHGLAMRYVGYKFTTANPLHDFYYIGTVRIYLRARAHGTHQAWRTVACKNVRAH